MIKLSKGRDPRLQLSIASSFVSFKLMKAFFVEVVY